MDHAETLLRYAELINRHEFDLVAPLLAPDATFWFNDGSHRGLAALRDAFERTWRQIAEETYWLEDIAWIAAGPGAAAATYTYRWRGLVDGVTREGRGRGTSVLRQDPDGWRIVHEHLSRFPPG